MCLSASECVCVCLLPRPRGSRLLSLDRTEPTWVSLSLPPSPAVSTPHSTPPTHLLTSLHPLHPPVTSCLCAPSLSSLCSQACLVHRLEFTLKCRFLFFFLLKLNYPPPAHAIAPQSGEKLAVARFGSADDCSPGVTSLWTPALSRRHERSSMNSHIRQEDPS